MKITFNLTEADIKRAIINLIQFEKGVTVKHVYLNYYQADSRDPRETSQVSATASE